MSQHTDYTISNVSFANFRSELNTILGAINTLNSGTSAPGSAAAGSLFLDTTSATTPTLKFYDGSDWISLCTFNYSGNTVNWLDNTVTADLSGDSSPQLGGDLDMVTYDIVTTSNRDIDIIPHGTGDVNLGADTVQVGDNDADATITTQGTGDLILNTNNGSSSGNITLADGANGNIKLSPNGTGEILVGAGDADGDITTNGAYDLIIDTNEGTNAGNITLSNGANGNIDITTNGTGSINFNDLPLIPQQALTSTGGAVAWDAQAKPNAYHLTTENTAISEPSNAVEGAFICIEINYNGSHTMGWNAIFNFAADTPPTTTDTDGKTDILSFRYNGSIWQEIGRTLNIPES